MLSKTARAIQILIKIHKDELDKLIIQINDLESQQEQLRRILSNLAHKVKLELEQHYSNEYSFMLRNFLKKAKYDKEQLLIKIENNNKAILILRDKLYEKFAEIKKFEIALQNLLAQEASILKKKEEKMYDEFNTNKFIFDKNTNNDTNINNK